MERGVSAKMVSFRETVLLLDGCCSQPASRATRTVTVLEELLILAGADGVTYSWRDICGCCLS